MKKSLLFSFVAGLVMCTSSSVMAKAAKPSQMKNIFPIGIWFDGRVEGINCPQGYVNVPFGIENAKSYYEKTFADIKSHGMDIVVIPNTPPQYRGTLLSAADKAGIKVVLEIVELAYVDFGGDLSVRSPYMVTDEKVLRQRLTDLIRPLKKHKSLFCYQIIDEPPATLADNFQRVAQILTELDSTHPAFSCLCYEGELSRSSAMGTQMIVFDRYPIREESKPGDYDFQSYISVLEQLRNHSRDNEIPYWMAVQACALPGHLRLPTEAELRLLTYLPLSRNCKGIFFFLYNSMTQTEKLEGLVDTELRPGPLWPHAAKLAGELKQLTPVILDIKPAAEFAFNTNKKVDVQSFEDSKKQKYIFVTNLDPANAVTEVIKLKADSKPKQARNILTDKTMQTDNLDNESISIEVNNEAGGCVILRLE